MAHAVHLDDAAVARFAATGTGVAHCPSSNARLGAGIARTRDLVDAGVPVGLGVDGAASNEAGSLLEELRHAALFARARGGPTALSVREALRLATDGGAQVLGRDDEIGSHRGRQARRPRAVAGRHPAARRHRRPGGRPRAGVRRRRCELLLVDGRPVVEHDRLVTVDEDELARDAAAASRPAAGAGSAPMTATRRVPAARTDGGVGTDASRPDGTLKVTGEFAYGSDLWADEMLWGVTLRSPHPSARIRSIDLGPALAVPGVYAVLTADDVPGEKRYGLEVDDQPVLAIGVVRYQGEPVALVAAEHPETARRAAARIVVDYEVLEPVTDARAALEPGAPVLHPEETPVVERSGRTRTCTRAATCSGT